MLAPENVNLEPLLALGRELATFVGIPESAPLAAAHPVKLFDFSSRARCLAPFRVLAVDKEMRPNCLDLEVCACLRDAQTRHLSHVATAAADAAAKCAAAADANEARQQELGGQAAEAAATAKAAPNAHAKQQALRGLEWKQASLD